MSDFLNQWAAKRREEWDEHVRPEVRAFAEYGRITNAEYEVFVNRMKGLNSYERETLYPAMDDECLIKRIEYCLKNCRNYAASHGYRPASTYDEALVTVFAPLLIERLRDK